jgi:ATP-dependent DNA helicase RecG
MYIVAEDTESNASFTLQLPINGGNEEFQKELLTVPGMRWDGKRSLYVFPEHRRTALALRQVLSHDSAQALTPNLSDNVTKRLKTAANLSTGEDATLFVDENSKIIKILTPHSNALRDDLVQANGKWCPTGWEIPVDSARKIIELSQKHNLRLSPEIIDAAETAHGTIMYDGTVDGLRGVPVTELVSVPEKGRGKQVPLSERFADIGINNVYDLLMTVPRRYLDRSSLAPISKMEIGKDAGVIATVTSVGKYDRVKRIVRHTVKDDTGTIQVTFFSSPWQAYRFKVGDKVAMWGKLDVWEGGRSRVLQMTNPIMDPISDDMALIVPIYPQSAKNSVTTWDLHTAAMEGVRRLGNLVDPLPYGTIQKLDLLARGDAYKQVHNPDSINQAEAARRRLAFDEFLRMQLVLLMGKYELDDAKNGIVHNPNYLLTKPYLESLPYTITGAQRKALTEIRENLTSQSPMHRLLQGDVGSGKTTVAIVTALMSVESGHQAAIMAPTEILAWQLYKESTDTTKNLIKSNGNHVSVAYLSSKIRVKEKREILAKLAANEIDLIIGTHSLLSPDVEFADLGVVVIDEQHRFGVEQRASLKDKTSGKSELVPDMLVMTATPIPRTAAMTIYGDLDLTVLDELPPGRTPIETEWVRRDPVLDSPLEHPWNVLREEILQGRQGYVVCPLVVESEKLQAASAVETFEILRNGALAGLRVGLVHGQLLARERDEAMEAFKDGKLDVIVATTVIEVGVNVQNASIMVILDAPRFGLAQLHQLRGRVGRAQYASSCFLVGEPSSADGVERMKAMVRTTSGFELSEVDAKLRGVGSVYGARQAGKDSDLRVGDLVSDLDLVIASRETARHILENDRALMRQPVLRNEVVTAIGPEAAAWLTKS